MLKYLLLVLSLGTASCAREPDFTLDGKPHYVNRRCVSSHTERRLEYGFHMMTITGGVGKMGLGYVTREVCDEYVLDTVVAQ